MGGWVKEGRVGIKGDKVLDGAETAAVNHNG